MVAMYSRSVLLMALMFGCSDAPDAVSFDDSDGIASSVDDCDCSYDDGSHGDPSVQINCDGGIFDNLSFYVESNVPAVDHGTQLLFGVSGEFGQFRGSGIGSFTSIGPQRRGDGPDQIVRSIEGIELQWDEQEACDAANGCAGDMFHLKAGALHAGSGGCEDFWATVDQETSGI
jgi:hypothetical protein